MSYKIIKAFSWNALENKSPGDGFGSYVGNVSRKKILSESIRMLHNICNRAYLKGQARYCLLCRNVGKIQNLAQFSLYRAVESYQELRTFVGDYDVELKSF